MGATQGVLLLMMGALALYLMWNSRSPFNKGGDGTAIPTPPALDLTPPKPTPDTAPPGSDTGKGGEPPFWGGNPFSPTPMCYDGFEPKQIAGKWVCIPTGHTPTIH